MDGKPFLSSLVKDSIEANAPQFFLDCSTMSQVILAVQDSGRDILRDLFKLTRNYVHLLDKLRNELLIV